MIKDENTCSICNKKFKIRNALNQHIGHVHETEVLNLRAAGMSENREVPVSFGGPNLPPLDLLGAMATPAPPGTTGLDLQAPVETGSLLDLLG